VIHRTDKNLLTPLLVLAPLSASVTLGLAVSVFLVEAVLWGGFLLLALMAVVLLHCLLDGLGALSVGLRGGLAAFAAAAAPAALSAILRR
jgi:hypothetical protein